MFLKIKKIIKSVEVKNVIINLSEKFLTFLLLLLGKYLSVEKYGELISIYSLILLFTAISSGAVIHKAKEYFCRKMLLAQENLRP